MMLRRTVLRGLGAAAAGFAVAAWSGAPSVAQEIFGRELMTEAEIAEQQRLMRGAATEAERERLRLEHHERMTARARERGVTLPEDPQARGMGQGQGQGQGKGMGQGKGGGQGKGQGGGQGQPPIRKGQGQSG